MSLYVCRRDDDCSNAVYVPQANSGKETQARYDRCCKIAGDIIVNFHRNPVRSFNLDGGLFRRRINYPPAFAIALNYEHGESLKFLRDEELSR